MRTCELLCPCNTVFGYLRKFNNTVNFGCESRIEGSLKQEPLIKCNEGYFSVNHLGELNMTKFNNRFIAFFFIIQIVFLSGCASAPEQVENNERYNDMVITTKVHEAIIDDLSLRPFEINVRTIKGVVELSGLVYTRDQMDRAIAIAKTVNGVKLIRSDLRIHPGWGDY